jgi:cobalt-precorrin-7 (C5)-methyltransferase
MSKLYIVGVGPGSKDYLTFTANEIIKSSDIIIGSRRALDLFKNFKGQKIELESKNIKDRLNFAISKLKEGLSVSLLSTGDPGFSGILKPVLKMSKDIDLEIVPGISSIQLCAAKLQIPWDDANLITLHGKKISSDILKIIETDVPTMILPNSNPNEIAEFLIENDVDPNKKVAICEKLGYYDEKIVRTSLNGVKKSKFSYMCVMVLY